MIILNQTSSQADTPQYFSTKRVEVPVIKKTTLPTSKDFCTCLIQCVPALKAFTDGIGTDPIKNDWHSVFIPTVNTSTVTDSTIVGTITNIQSGLVTTLADTTHGTLYEGDNYWWFKVDWYKIFNTLGLGKYQIHVVESAISGGETINELKTPVFNLLPYSDEAANGTVRLYSKQSGKLNHGNDYSNIDNIVALGTRLIPFEQQTRLPGRLYIKNEEIENDHLVLNNPNLSTYQVKDQLRPTYQLDLHLLSARQIMPVVFDDMFGNELYITDYNVYNHVVDPRDFQANQYIDLPVRRESVTIPNPSGTAKRKTYTFDMVYEYDNIFKTNN